MDPQWMSYLLTVTKPYIQLSRIHYITGPTPLFWPCAWGLTLGATKAHLAPQTLATQLWWYFLGSLVLHSVGATWNDVCDRDLDGKVERTKNRPLVKGTATVTGALWFMLPQIILLVYLLRLNNDLSFYLGAFDLFFWVPIYPLMKRITYWPQAWLGVACGFGVLVADADLTNAVRTPTLMLFLGAWCWCMHYDTVYGMMDLQDDLTAGIYSTAVLFGKSARLILFAFAVAFIACLFEAGWQLRAGWMYYVFAVGFGGIHLMWQTFSVNFDDKSSCVRVFASNGTQFGYMVWAGLLTEYWAKVM